MRLADLQRLTLPVCPRCPVWHRGYPEQTTVDLEVWMNAARRLLAALLVALFALSAVACSAEGNVDGEGAGAEINAEGDGEGEGD